MIYRIVTRGAQGEIKISDYQSSEEVLKHYIQIGTEEYSTRLELRGFPIFHGLIGPMPDHIISDYQDGRFLPSPNGNKSSHAAYEEKNEVARYETPEVFEKMTKIWSAPKRKKRNFLIRKSQI